MKTVDILLYDGVDELDFCGPYETLASCRRLVDGKWSEKPAFHVQTVADKRSTVSCSHGLCVLPDKSLAQAFEADIIIVPGGPGAIAPGTTLPPRTILPMAALIWSSAICRAWA